MRKPEEIATAFDHPTRFEGVNGYFLVGIGGAGMSGLARILHRDGLRVAGTDMTGGTETDALIAMGIPVHIGHDAQPLQNFASGETALVVSDAIDLDGSPEVAYARSQGWPLFRRSQLLGYLLRNHRVIAVTGTHGKTTTTGMIGSALQSAGLDPFVVVGAVIPQWGDSIIYGAGPWAVVEACEAYDSFHDLQPEIVVLTNLEPDHLDYHGTWANLKASVTRFVDRLPTDHGILIYGAEDAGAQEIATLATARTLGYRAADGEALGELSVPGHHNRINAAGARTVAEFIGAPLDRAEAGIRNFGGADRRMQLVHQDDEIAIYDDYAHHPTEVAASIQALRERHPDRRIVVVFQPHLYSRTRDQLAGFGESLSQADFVVLTDIYPAREAAIPGVSSAVLSELVTGPFRYVPSRHLLPQSLLQLAKPGDVIVGMGAGNIARFAPDFHAEWTAHLCRPHRIAVVYGGDSAEREVSLHSGMAVAKALRGQGFDAELVDITERLHSGRGVRDFVGANRFDIAFLAVHGENAEDGAIQGLLELLHVPYTGSGIKASALAMDKAAAKTILELHGIRTPRGVLLSPGQRPEGLRAPLIVKPNAQGSTVGLGFVESDAQLDAALDRAFAYGDALVEEWVRGMEVSTPVLNGEPLPVVEIAPASGRYDFASKYTPGATEEVVPARLPQSVLNEIGEIAVRAHRALGCEGVTRTDAIIRPRPDSPYWTSGGPADPSWFDGAEIFVLEVNTLPGMTGTSLVPNSAAAAGIAFPDLCERILREAWSRHIAP